MIYPQVREAPSSTLPNAYSPEQLAAAWLLLSATSTTHKTFRGAASQLQLQRAGEVIISGPYETGKTLAALHLLDALARNHAHLRGAILRKVRNDLDSTALDTFRRHILREDVMVYGGEHPEFFDYPNQSRIWIGGLDRPGKTLSGERDVIYVNQVEEMMLGDWETLTTRTTGRAGILSPGLLFGDCNPGPPSHWIKHRAGLTLLESRHEDNPMLFADDGRLTAQGQRTMAVLDALSGTRYLRGRKGLWVQAEGVVYDEFDPAIHVIDEMPQGWQLWRKMRAIDFGYSNPFVCQWWAIDGDSRMILYREVYRTRRLVEDHARDIVRLSEDESISVTVADHDAEDRATLERHGVPTIAADKRISVGIEAVKLRKRQAGDGRVRLFYLRSALVQRDEELAAKRLPVSTLEENEMYTWPKAADGKPLKEVPVDAFNHGMDAERYAVMDVDNGVGSLVEW